MDILQTGITSENTVNGFGIFGIGKNKKSGLNFGMELSETLKSLSSSGDINSDIIQSIISKLSTNSELIETGDKAMLSDLENPDIAMNELLALFSLSSSFDGLKKLGENLNINLENFITQLKSSVNNTDVQLNNSTENILKIIENAFNSEEFKALFNSNSDKVVSEKEISAKLNELLDTINQNISPKEKIAIKNTLRLFHNQNNIELSDFEKSIIPHKDLQINSRELENRSDNNSKSISNNTQLLQKLNASIPQSTIEQIALENNPNSPVKIKIENSKYENIKADQKAVNIQTVNNIQSNFEQSGFDFTGNFDEKIKNEIRSIFDSKIELNQLNTAKFDQILNQTKDTGKVLSYSNIKLEEFENVAKTMIKSAMPNGSAKAQLTLTPKSLGTVFVELAISDNVVTMNIKTETNEAAKALEKQIHALKDKFALQGLQADNITIKTNENTETDLTQNGFTKNNQSDEQKEKRNFVLQNTNLKQDDIETNSNKDVVNKNITTANLIEKYI